MKLKYEQFFFIFIISLGITLSLSAGFQPLKNPETSLSTDQSDNELLKATENILTQNCSVSGCHSGAYPKMNLNLEKDKFIKALLNIPGQEISSLKLVDTQIPEKSYILMKIKGDTEIVGGRMPLFAPPLQEKEIQTLENWIFSLKKSQIKKDEILTRAATSLALEKQERVNKRKFKKPSFWGTRIINLPTTQSIRKNHFLFRISHRYRPAIDSGYDTFFGIDGPAFILLSFGYGISDNLNLTLARSNLFQEFELSLDWIILNQGKRPALPFSAAISIGTSLVTQTSPGEGVFQSDNMKFNLKFILSHQFSERLSFLLVPGYSSNTNHWEPFPDGTLALGTGGRLMFFNDFSLVWEWIPVLSGYKANSNGWGLGVEKKIGGHVFQVFILNSTGLTSDQFISGGDFRLKDKDFRLGFNIFRKF